MINFNLINWENSDDIDWGNEWSDYWNILSKKHQSLGDLDIFDLTDKYHKLLTKSLEPFNKVEITLNKNIIDKFYESLCEIVIEYFAEIFTEIFLNNGYDECDCPCAILNTIHDYENLDKLNYGELKFLLHILVNEILEVNLDYCTFSVNLYLKCDNINEFIEYLLELYNEEVDLDDLFQYYHIYMRKCNNYKVTISDILFDHNVAISDKIDIRNCEEIYLDDKNFIGDDLTISMTYILNYPFTEISNSYEND